ncbi:signal recognition particle-docking protein FtsY [Oenococcus kitaharae]|uniref:Signal recognition particle receptor FtsY n=1 Tax=Oenococcus kitaharae DSM 17330 TaxID=1045004 RepID=G9WIG7_9LACO|nr:signal recognition particle-docking protein FtsY [Oenococcus kitaharae]EHN58979.1 FtsY-like signal recognition particle receptor protein (alpha subunit) [Oenococcus kitaharae DSM 17330]OEY81711.1 cell division protein FtsY [Oenococcus kitaharae]OEY83942.1 cell division protein FtsY [Oenococcus kitaharae]OEY85702.1 cell division protein FtsY [Oenococcus kitaharae]
MSLFDRLLGRKKDEETPQKTFLGKVKDALAPLSADEDQTLAENKPASTPQKPAESDSASSEDHYEAGLTKTRSSFAEKFQLLMANFRAVDENFFDELEETLIAADVGFEIALKISDELQDEVRLKNATSKKEVQETIIEKLVDVYDQAGNGEDNSMHMAAAGNPSVFLFVGVNGVGKTTTIGKMAQLYRQQSKKVLLAAADTFRAGATEQLVEWAKRDQVDVVTGKEKSDPAAVVFDAVKRAVDQHYDILFVDTAGRLQNNENLMRELEKMKKTITRQLPEAPQEVLLVLDATTGQNALQQARLFKDSTDVTGLVLTKLDGTAKGGIVLAIRQELHLPVKWVGLGEKVTDLAPFDADQFVYGLFKDLI